MLQNYKLYLKKQKDLTMCHSFLTFDNTKLSKRSFPPVNIAFMSIKIAHTRIFYVRYYKDTLSTGKLKIEN